jgi:mRNA-degrading endonuclease toxin of MazEF toxin-antitoxin module
MKSPQRGEVWLVDLGMAAKVRPALAISVPVEDIDRALVTLVPHTTSPRQSRFEVAVCARQTGQTVGETYGCATVVRGTDRVSVARAGSCKLRCLTDCSRRR